MADSVGKGIALGERFKYDTTSGTAAFNNALSKRYNEKAAAEKNVVDALDFKIDYKEWLPVYGKAAAEKQAELYNKYLQYKSENKSTALNRIRSDLYNARQEIGRLKGDNDRAKAYVTQKDGMLRNASLVKDLTSTETALADLSKYNDNYFTTVGANGEFAFRPVEEMQPASFINYDDQDYDKVIGRSKRSETAGKMDVEYVEVLKPEAIRRNAESLALNPQFRDNVLAANPNILSLPPQEQVKSVYDAAFSIAQKMQRPSRSEWIMADLPNATGSGADKDKRDKPPIVENTHQTLLVSTGEMKEEKVGDEVVMNPVRVQKNSLIPLSVAIPNVPAVTIPLDDRVINANTNQYISGDDLNQTVTFKPDMGYSEKLKNTGKWENYVMGTATINVEKQRDIVTQKVITYKMPYDKLQSAIEGKYDMTDFDAKFNELAGGAKKEIKSSDISSRAKAAGYTYQEYRKLLTEKGVKIID